MTEDPVFGVLLMVSQVPVDGLGGWAARGRKCLAFSNALNLVLGSLMDHGWLFLFWITAIPAMASQPLVICFPAAPCVVSTALQISFRALGTS
jgi:hypothetical protein